MQEAKSLTNMAVSVMFSVMIIAGCLTLVGLGYQMWSYFSRQDAANQKMKDYVNYVAYDDVTIRGQEVISLFQYAKNEGLFISVFTETTQAAGTNDINNVQPSVASSDIHLYVPETCPWATIYDGRDRIPIIHDNSNITSALQATVQQITSAAGSPTYSRCTCCFPSLDTYDKLVQGFTNNYGTWTHLGHPSGSNSYAAYKSVLVYDSDTSTDVIGFILIRQAPETTVFN